MNGRASVVATSKARVWMILVSLVCAILASALPAAQPASAGTGAWTTSGPIDNIGTVAVAPSDNNVVYALGSSGVWRSHNGGSSWHKMGTRVLDKYAPLAVSPTSHDTIYGGTAEGVLKSTNGGTSWSVALADLSVQSLAVHPTNGSIVYAGTRNASNQARIYKTTDGGRSWSHSGGIIIAEMGTPAVVDIEINPSEPDNVFAAIQTYHGGHVRQSSDGGHTWTLQGVGGVPPLYLPSAMAIVPMRDAVRVYTGWQVSGSKALVRSDNDGIAWCNLTRLLPDAGGSVAGIVIPDNDKDWVVAAFGGTSDAPGGVFLSTDGGIIWRDKELGQNPQGIAWASRSNTIFVSTPSGVYQYTMILPVGPATISYRSPAS